MLDARKHFHELSSKLAAVAYMSFSKNCVNA
jgi:hypothetical protein